MILQFCCTCHTRRYVVVVVVVVGCVHSQMCPLHLAAVASIRVHQQMVLGFPFCLFVHIAPYASDWDAALLSACEPLRAAVNWEAVSLVIVLGKHVAQRK